MKGLGDLMKQAQAMQEQMETMRREIAEITVVGESGAGLVRVTMHGDHRVQRVELDPSLTNEETQVVEDLIAAACNDAVRKVQSAHSDKMSSMAQGLGLPSGSLPFSF